MSLLHQIFLILTAASVLAAKTGNCGLKLVISGQSRVVGTITMSVVAGNILYEVQSDVPDFTIYNTLVALN